MELRINNEYIKSAARIILSLVFLNTLVACGSSDDNEAAAKNITTTEIPLAVKKLTLSGGTLRAFVTIDGDTANRTEMTIDTTGTGSASASIPGLSLATHTVIISYEYTDGAGNVIVLATATNTIDLTSGSVSLSFVESDYDLASYDDDGDGISNAAEVAAGSDPLDSTSGSTDCVLGTSTIGNCTLG